MTLTLEDLNAIGELIDTRLDVKLDEKLNERFASQNAMIEARFARQNEMIYTLFAEQDERIDMKFDMQDTKFEKRFDLIDGRLDKVELELRHIRVIDLENTIYPKLNDISAIISSTSERYHKEADKINKIETDLWAVTEAVKRHLNETSA